MMKTTRIACLALLALVCFATGPSRASNFDFGRYHALVIGNNEYVNLPRLETAVHDAETVAGLLEGRYGFDVKLLRNATKDDILRAVNDYRAELTEKDNLLIYYAGHGYLDRQTGTGYWQPVDAEAEDDLEWIANGELTRRLNAMSARHVMVIADSCYSGTLVRTASSKLATGAERDEWLRRVAEKRSRTAIVSGGLEPVMDAGGGSHSVFAAALIASLSENDKPLEGQELFRRVSRPVVVNSDQTPQYSDIRRAGHEGGEFIFLPKTTARPGPVSGGEKAPPASARGNEGALDLAFWSEIKDEADPALFQAYLDEFPNGTFAALAKRRIAKLGQGTGGVSGGSGADERKVAVGTFPKAPGESFRDCEECPEMVVLPAGTFAMGSPTTEKDRFGGEGPRHPVNIAKPFAVGRFEVTRKQFVHFIRETGHVPESGCRAWDADKNKWRTNKKKSWKDPGFAYTEDHPQNCISWHDAQAYVDWLSRRTGKPYRLLSEAEWEYAARGGAEARRYWGKDRDDEEVCTYANGADAATDFEFRYQTCSDGIGRQTAAVGGFKPNAFGLHDMIGNVWEWVEDCWNDGYDGAPDHGGVWTTGDCSRRALRGGSWGTDGRFLRAAVRLGFKTENRNVNLGFRVARTL